MFSSARGLRLFFWLGTDKRNWMDDSCEARRREEGKVSSGSASGSSTEDGQTPTSDTCPYDEELTHKVSAHVW